MLKKSKMTRFFKIISLSEGISSFLLFFLAMPLKYIFGNPILISPIGTTHGILFMLYTFLAVYLKFEQDWTFKKFCIVFIGAIIPGGTFYIDKKYF